MMTQENATTIQVWDPIIRFGHWLIVAGFFIAYIVEDDNLVVHVWAGYTVALVIFVRIIWGFVGPKSAKFSDFLVRPTQMLAYARDLMRGRSKRYLGHSPAGGAMIVALLICLSVITVSGLMVYAYEENAGPMSAYVNTPSVSEGITRMRPHDAEFEESEEFWEETHEIAANATILLVLLHVLGVLFASRAHRENLTSAMVSGRKRAATDKD
jgi:cytochrome b